MGLVLHLWIIKLMSLTAYSVGQVLTAACDLARNALGFHNKNSEASENEMIHLAGFVVKGKISIVYNSYMIGFPKFFQELSHLFLGSSSLSLTLAEMDTYVYNKQ